jgi:hypothetical protein
MRNGRRGNWLFGAGVTVGVMAGLIIGRRNRMCRMPHLDTWQRTLTEQWGEVGAAMLASRMLEKYQALYTRRPRFAQRILQLHLERNILPGLALYQVMLEETGTQEDALAEARDLFEVASVENHAIPLLPGNSSELYHSCLGMLATYGAPELSVIFQDGKQK